MKVFLQSRFVIVTKLVMTDQLRRDHHQGKKEGKCQIFSREVQTRERISRQRDDKHHDSGRYDVKNRVLLR